jgi:hypothetical protein
MPVLLIIARQAAETLAAYHRGRIEQTLGSQRAYHEEMHRRCQVDIEDMKRQLATSGVTVEKSGVGRTLPRRRNGTEDRRDAPAAGMARVGEGPAGDGSASAGDRGCRANHNERNDGIAHAT